MRLLFCFVSVCLASQLLLRSCDRFSSRPPQCFSSWVTFFPRKVRRQDRNIAYSKLPWRSWVITLPITISYRQNARQSKSFENSWKSLYYKSKLTIFTIALQFLTNKRYSQYDSMLLWQFGEQFWLPCQALSPLETVRGQSYKDYYVISFMVRTSLDSLLRSRFLGCHTTLPPKKRLLTTEQHSFPLCLWFGRGPKKRLRRRLRAQLYGLGYPRQPSSRATLAEVTFSLFLSKIQPAVYIRIANSSRGARQLGWASCLTSAGRVTLASGTTFLHINALAPLTGTSLGVANVT